MESPPRLLALFAVAVLSGGIGCGSDDEDGPQDGTTEVRACEPGYTPCVPSYPPDVDCPEVGKTVEVTGSDPHGLDADGDGSGCEAE